jgi:hypothetical protein
VRKLIAFVILACGIIFAQTKRPERTVQANAIKSEHDPAVRIELPSEVQYAGADRFVLYGIADCELHAFVEADAQKNVQRLYWVQFEGYLPSKPKLKHTYDSPRHANLGGWDFYVDSWVLASDAERKPGSDLEHIERLIRRKGYTLPDGMMYVRLVHLLDATKRKELMIIYGEDLKSTGFTAADLDKGGKAHSRWKTIDERLIERSENRVKVEPPMP